MRAREVSAENGRVQTVLGIVGDPDRLLLGVIRDDTQHGTENLFLSDRHVVLHVDEHRRLHEASRLETVRVTLATGEHLRTFLDALADTRLHALVLLLGHHRSYSRLGISRIADDEIVHGFPYRPLHIAETGLRYKQPGSGSAR